jgi:hypothetical protein
MHHPTLTPIKSSALAGAHYNDDTHELTVEFAGGNRYVYHDVAREKFDSLLAAESSGSYFSKNVRSLHAHTKVGK